MRLRGSVIGALNLFNLSTGQMRPGDVQAAQAFADVATIAILQHRAALEIQAVNTQLSEALTSRILIEQAKGMVAQHQGIDMEEAFLRLRNHARNRNVRLVDLAQSIISADPSAPAVVLDPLPTAKGRLRNS